MGRGDRVKFWELASVCREEPQLMQLLGDRTEWTTYLDWFRDFDRIVSLQDRRKLNAEIPDEACLHVLRGSRLEFFLSDGYVRLRSMDPDAERLAASDVFLRFGGSFLEEVCESGLAPG
jgi:hypothetical protein